MNDLKRSHPDRNDNNKDDNNDDNNNSNRYSDEREKRRRVQDDSRASTGSSVGAGAVAGTAGTGARGAGAGGGGGVKGTPGPGSKGNAAGAGSKRMFGALMGHLGRAKKMLKEDSEVIQVLHSLSHSLTRLLRRVYVWLIFSLITLNHALFSLPHSLTHPRISGASGETTGGATEEQRRE
jgi:hypothetical protein